MELGLAVMACSGPTVMVHHSGATSNHRADEASARSLGDCRTYRQEAAATPDRAHPAVLTSESPILAQDGRWPSMGRSGGGTAWLQWLHSGLVRVR